MQPFNLELPDGKMMAFNALPNGDIQINISKVGERSVSEGGKQTVQPGGRVNLNTFIVPKNRRDFLADKLKIT